MDKLLLVRRTRIVLTAFLVVALFSFSIPSTHAAVPSIMSFQGRLTNSSGALLGGSGTTHWFQFRIYDAITSGTLLWESNSANGVPVTVTQGVFNTLLGDTSLTNMAAMDVDFSKPTRYLEISVSSTAATGPFETMTPRQRIGASPYAINAETVHGGRFINATGVGQFGGLATAAYSRFGTATSTHGLDNDSQALFSSNAEFDGQIFIDNSASISLNFEVVGYASLSALFGLGLTDCDSTTGDKALNWDSSTGRFSCTDDNTGGAVIEVRESSAANGTSISSLSFDAGGFNVSFGGTESLIKIDYVNGPASRSIDQAISGAWSFSARTLFSTASAFAGFEAALLKAATVGSDSSLTISPTDGQTFIVGTASISGTFEVAGTTKTSGLSVGSLSGLLSASTGTVSAISDGTTGQFLSWDRSYRALSAFAVDEAIPLITIGNTASSNFDRALTGTANQITITDNGANSTVVLSLSSLLSLTGASLSSNFEVAGYASISNFRLPLVGGATLGDCDAAGDTLNWDATTGRFTCGTDLDTTGVASNSLNFDELQSALVLDTDTTITGGSFALTFDHASVSGTFEVAGTTKTNALSIGSLSGLLSASTGAVSAIADGTNGQFLSWDRTYRSLGSFAVDEAIALVSIGTTASSNYERALTGTSNQLTITDNGANSTVVLSIPSLFSITTASLSSNLEVSGTASISNMRLLSVTTGNVLGDCDAAGDTLNWDTTTGRFICGTDASGVTSAIREGTGAFDSTSSLSFNAAHFVVALDDVEASISLDWGAGGPASLSQAETIIGNWVNTVNPWADDEVVDTITASNYLLLTGGNLSGNLTGTGASFSSGEFTSYASASAFFGSAFSTVGDCNDATEAIAWTTTGVFSCRSVQDLDSTLTALAAYNTNGILTQTAADTFVGRTLTGTTNQITLTNGDGVSGNPTVSIPALLSIAAASLSSNLEVSGTASISNFRLLSALTGVTLGDCDAAGDTLNWDVTTGRFTCGSDLDTTGVASNSLNFDELQSALVLDVDTTITGGAFALTFDRASVSGTFEVTGTTKTAGLNIGSLTGLLSATTGTVSAITDGTTGQFLSWDRTYRSLGAFAADEAIPLITLGNTASSNFDRALTGTVNQITITDNGANSTVVLSLSSLLSLTTASLSSNFEVAGYASISNFRLPLVGGATLGDCDAAGDTLNWDATTGRFTCGSDASGGGGGSSAVREGTGTFDSTSSLSFNAAHFVVAFDDTEASISLDWGAGGPASLSQNETITGNWVNTANPWADDEVVDTITASNYLLLSGGTLVGNLAGTGASLSLTEFTSYASASAFLGSAFSAVGDCNDATEAIAWTTTGIFSCRSVQDLDSTLTALAAYNTNGILTQTGADTFTGRTLTGTANQIDIANGDGVSGNPTLSFSSLLSITRASLSSNFEVAGYASISNTRLLSATTGTTLGDCDAAGDTLNWDTTTGRFICGTDASGASSNSLNFDELQSALVLDENTTITGGAFALTFDHASISGNLEMRGIASASQFRGNAFAGLTGTDGCSAAGDTLNYVASTGIFTCGSDTSGGGGGVASNSLDFDEFVNAMTLDANTTISSGSGQFGLTIATTVSMSHGLEIRNGGYASASRYFGAGLNDCDGVNDILNWTASGSNRGKFSCRKTGAQVSVAWGSTDLAISRAAPATYAVNSTGRELGLYRVTAATTFSVASSALDRYRVNASGYVNMCETNLTAALTAGVFEVAVYKNDVLVTDMCRMTSAANASRSFQQILNSTQVTFVAGDRLVVLASTNGSLAPITTDPLVRLNLVFNGVDLAEYYYTKDEELSTGMIAQADSSVFAGVSKAEDTNSVLGVISDAAGLTLGSKDGPARPVLVALSGRVPVLVKGKITSGDYIALSNEAGIGIKSEKSGYIVGQAIEDKNYDEIGSVYMFIKNSYSIGDPSWADKLSVVSSRSEGLTVESRSTSGKEILTYLLDTGQSYTASNSISEVFTDRLTANLGVIAPQITTKKLDVDYIESSSGDGVLIRLASGSSFAITTSTSAGFSMSASRSEVFSIDTRGNVFLAGELTAGSIKGLEVFDQKLASISMNLEAMLGEFGGTASSSEELALRLAGLEANFGLEFENVLEVRSLTIFSGGLKIDTVGAIGTEIGFMDDVNFFGRPYFSSDTGGFIIVQQGSVHASVSFESEYLSQPVVNANISLNSASASAVDEQVLFDGDVRYVVTQKNTKGFAIKLNKPAPFDIQFSWIALAVKDAKTFFSSINLLATPVPAPTPEPTSEPTPEDTPETISEETPTASPEPTLEPTPETTPEPTETSTPEVTPEPTVEPTPESSPEAVASEESGE